MAARLGVIGGSGIYSLPELDVVERREVSTPYGNPSDSLTIGRLGETDVVFLPRHGSGHSQIPTELPYRANIYALKWLGVTHLLSVSAVGSLTERLPPLSIVMPDQIIDRTTSRRGTFFGDGAVAHVGLADPFCSVFQASIADAGTRAGVAVTTGGAYVCIEGPQFSTRAESMLYRSWNGAVIGMTAMPEARLAREAELCYATVAMVTDFDVWHESEGPVTVDMVIANLNQNADRARALLVALADAPLSERSCPCQDALRNAIVTSPEHVLPETRARLGVIAERYLADSFPTA